MRMTIVVAIAANGVIGRDGGLPWRLPSDLAHFKRLTMGHTLVMGRRTWESIGRALPGRRTIVVSRRGALELPDGVDHASSLDDAVGLARGRGESELFLVGGASLYQEGLGLADRMVITWVDDSVEGDVHFPAVGWGEWRELGRVAPPADPRDEHPYVVVEYERAATCSSSPDLV
jgi:dihydrofolate reductase